MNLVEMEAALGSARHRQVADVDGIKRAAEERNPALTRMGPGCAVAVRLGNAQRSSVRVVALSCSEVP
jgi:hypothetical protein